MKDFTEHIILTTKNLSIGYQHKKETKIVASELNIDIKQGKLITVIGKNGIGKSTFLRTISKVQKPLLGNVYVNGKDLEKYDHKTLATKLSLVLTERLPESQLNVFEIIALGRQPYTNWIDNLSENDINKIDWAIEATEISHLQHKPFYELSDGQLQRVLIARALAQDTEIIILDEPTAHLDLYNKVKIITLLKDLVTKTNKTIIMSSHEINLALQLSDEIILFKKGGILSDTPQNLINKDVFHDLFPKNILQFDKNIQQFIIK